MKKTISMVLAVLIAALAICAMSIAAFADGKPNEDDMVVSTTVTTTATTTEATTTTTTEATTATTAAATENGETTIDPSKLQEDLSNLIGGITEKVTLPDVLATTKEGETFYVDKTTTKAAAVTPATTKAPAAVSSTIPNTGSSLAIPAVALLVLAAGTIAVIKTKEDR